MRAIAMVVFGVLLGALFLLRGLELLLATHEKSRAIFPLACAMLNAALFLQQWKRKSDDSNLYLSRLPFRRRL